MSTLFNNTQSCIFCLKTARTPGGVPRGRSLVCSREHACRQNNRDRLELDVMFVLKRRTYFCLKAGAPFQQLFGEVLVKLLGERGPNDTN